MSQHPSPLKAIRAKCLDCCADQPKEVRLCPLTRCPLWPFRMGHNPNRAGKTGQRAGATAGEAKSNREAGETNANGQADRQAGAGVAGVARGGDGGRGGGGVDAAVAGVGDD